MMNYCMVVDLQGCRLVGFRCMAYDYRIEIVVLLQGCNDVWV